MCKPCLVRVECWQSFALCFRSFRSGKIEAASVGGFKCGRNMVDFQVVYVCIICMISHVVVFFNNDANLISVKMSGICQLKVFKCTNARTRSLVSIFFTKTFFKNIVEENLYKHSQNRLILLKFLNKSSRKFIPPVSTVVKKVRTHL